MKEPATLRPQELADSLGVSVRYIRKLIASGALPAVRLPNAGQSGRVELGHYRITREAARHLLEQIGTVGTVESEHSTGRIQ